MNSTFNVRAVPPLHAVLAMLLFAAAALHADNLTLSNLNPLHRLPPDAGGNPTAGQFGGFSGISSSPSTQTTGSIIVNPPASGTLRLRTSFLGGSFASSPPEFLLGDLVGAPVQTFLDNQGRTAALRREPVRNSEATFKYRNNPGDPIRDFNPATEILGNRYFWSPHARFSVVTDDSGKFERQAVGSETGTFRDGFVFASQSGGARIVWRTDAPIGTVSPTDNTPVYGMVERNISVATSTRYPVRRIYWTEKGYKGPPVAVPVGDVQQVRIGYSDSFPAQVPVGQEAPPIGIDQGLPLRETFWFENATSDLHAFNIEGRVMVELLGELRTADGRRRQVGIEVVDVIQEANPGLVEVPIGERNYPLPPEDSSSQSYPLPDNPSQRTEALARIETNLNAYTPRLVLTQNVFTAQWTINGRFAYYAVKETASAADVQIYWNEVGLGGIQWPKFLNRYRQYWPVALGDYSLNIRPSEPSLNEATYPVFDSTALFELVYQDDIGNGQAIINNNGRFQVSLGNADPVNRSLLLLTSGDSFWYVRVESVLDTQMASNSRYQDYYSATVDDSIGELHDFNSGLGSATLSGSAALISDAVRLTNSVNGQVGTLRLPNPAAGQAMQAGFKATFDMTLGPTTNIPGDGLGFSVGNSTTEHTLEVYFDTYDNGGTGSTGVHVLVNGVHVAVNPLNPYTNGVAVPVQVELDESFGLNVTWNGIPVFTSLPVPGFTMQATDSYTFRANTGGANQVSIVDNVRLTPKTRLLAAVGERITAPPQASSIAGYVDLTKGDAIDATAYISPYGDDGLTGAEAGAIIPVNASLNKPGRANNNNLGIWWFKRVSPPGNLAGKIAPVMWPSIYRRYVISWPTTAPEIVLASNAGSGDLTADAAQGDIYFENDAAKTGYNPNEEHALMVAGRAYALRDDLNLANTSQPYVLVRYTDAVDARPAMKVFRVLRTNEIYDFDYDVKAGRVLNPPMPLAVMPLPLKGDGTSLNTEVTPSNIDPATPAATGSIAYYNGFTFEDRNGMKWIYRGQHNPVGIVPPMQMKFYYATLEGFAFPDPATGIDNPLPVGTLTPYLRPISSGNYVGDGRAATSGQEALTIRYRPYWPDQYPVESERSEVPSLQFAETLVKPKNGLPGFAGASSAHILYQQSIAKDTTRTQRSAVLHDATRRKIMPLGNLAPVSVISNGFNDAPPGPIYASEFKGIPSSIATTIEGGRTYFQNLPPHLQKRFYFDPTLGTKGGLVLEGKFQDEIVGDDYLQPNVLTASDLDTIKNLAIASQRNEWAALVEFGMITKLETFKESTEVPGTYVPDPTKDRYFQPTGLVAITDENQAVDSYALTAVGGGSGYVTLVLGNGTAFTDPSEPVQLHIIKVGDELYRGQVKPAPSNNPLSEQLTMQHTGDFAGRVQDYEFQWYYSPPVDGQPPLSRPDSASGAGSTWFPLSQVSPEVNQQPQIVINGSQPLLSLSDNYIVMRYRPKEGHKLRPAGSNWSDTQGWSDWTDPALAEGWIKRVLAGINPFNQRLSDFFNNAVNTDVSLLTQAGTRWEGDIPLTLQSAQDAGLIEIYETVLRRGMSFSIDGAPGVDYGPVNDALLLAAGYLNDLYMALGNEAYADAANPLISLDIDPQRLLQQQSLPSSLGTTIQNTATARFAFEGQVSNLLDEELTLLRGRDDFLTPGAQLSPVYNRFFWNFTRGINAGEVIYALNYNIAEKPDDNSDGKIDAADAARQYPQGHGDAYGHYLTALSNYYRLLSNQYFTWTPRVEAVNILGVPVTVDYQDERKLAAAAVGLGRTAVRIIDLERRKLPIASDQGWAALREYKENSSSGNTRTWGVEQWAARAGQGNYMHWMVVNALLPEEDSTHEGLQRIDRSTVEELDELANLGEQIQTTMDATNRRVNALDLSDDSILFDLSPTMLAAGSSHFDQVLSKAKAALQNVATAHARTVAQNANLRSLENQSGDYSFTIDQEERAYTLKLFDIYGGPYSGDIGPGKLYPEGYDGPDFFRPIYIDRPSVYDRTKLFGLSANGTRTFELPVSDSNFRDLIKKFTNSIFTAPKQARKIFSTYSDIKNVSYTLNLNDGPYQIATPEMGRRSYMGSIQRALQEVLAAEENVAIKARDLDRTRADYERRLQKFADDTKDITANTILEAMIVRGRINLERVSEMLDVAGKTIIQKEKTYDQLVASVVEAMPRVNGIDNDLTSGARAAVLASKAATNVGWSTLEIVAYRLKSALKLAYNLTETALDLAIKANNRDLGKRAIIEDLLAENTALTSNTYDLESAAVAYQRALEKYYNAVADGETLLVQRETFRKRASTAIQGARIRDVAFRAFRTESLEQYKIFYDQAARYAFLAAKAYDYETGQLGTANGNDFFSKIVATRSLGLVGEDGEPQFGGSTTGDPGLSSYLAQLQADWGVVKGRLGINNPDSYGTLFSLRRELFNLPYKEDGSAEDHIAWQDRLRSCLVSDLRSDPAIAMHALPMSNPSGLAQPGFVINFSSTIQTGRNFFGNMLAAGDSAYSSSSYSTKINNVGIVLQGYLGMNPYTSGNTGIPSAPTVNSPDALAATPYVYLIPAGVDTMRTPPLNGAAVTERHWLVFDHAMPLPYDIGSSGFGQTSTWTSSTSLSEPFFTPRKHQPFRATDNAGLFFVPGMTDYTNTRLIGRSVWNSNWKLVIPAQTLLANPQDGIERFIRSVKDIKLFIKSYSHAGN